MLTPNILPVHIYCHTLPGTTFGDKTGLRLGLQVGSDVVDDVAADVEQVTFFVPVRVDAIPDNGVVKFGGPSVHGKPGEKFLYLSWGCRNNGAWELVGRVKIHLKHLSPRQVRTALDGGAPVEFTVSMTRPGGKLVCGSVNLHG